MKLLQTYRKHLLFKLTGIAAIILVALSSAYFFMSANYVRSVQQNTRKLNEQLLAQTAGRVESYWNSLYNATTAFCYSPTTQQYFSSNSLNRLTDANELAAVFSNILMLDDHILSVYLYDTNDQQVASMGKSFSIDAGDLHIEEVIDIRQVSFSQKSRPYYELIYPVYNLSSLKYKNLLGTCVFILSQESFDDTLLNSQATENTDVFLLDSSDRILCSAKNSDSCGTTLAPETQKSTSERYFFSHTLICNHWKLVAFIPPSDLQNSDPALLNAQTLFYAISLALLILLLLYCNHSIIHPITRISTFIREINRKPNARILLERPDEIGTVAKSLNQMLDEKQEMQQEIERVKYLTYEMELSKKQSEILAYRSQINPHFLYNTFECIRDMALFYDIDEIADLTMALSNVFRFAVKETDIIPVETELEHIREYAKIIDYRFMGKIHIEIDAKDDILNCNVFKLLLQPLVENAVFHGLEKKIENGTVWVRVFTSETQELCFVVEDDGCGIPPELLKQIFASLDIEKSTNKIGIFNIYQRLKLYYKNQFSFDIKSELSKGTCITISIPKETNEGEKGKNL